MAAFIAADAFSLEHQGKLGSERQTGGYTSFTYSHEYALNSELDFSANLPGFCL